MSKENANFRLHGSPVNLTYRNKKKEDKKSTKSRPRSALQNSSFSSDTKESYKRPFSADAKERQPSTRSFLKAFSAELLQSYNSSPTTIKVLPPTTDILGPSNNTDYHYVKKDKDICSNASDYGSEDTYISLGTKIKAKAQLPLKTKNTNQRNLLKFRNIAKKGRKFMDAPITEEKTAQEYGVMVKIIERQRSPTRNDRSLPPSRSPSPSMKRNFESYFIPLEGEKKQDDRYAGMPFGASNIPNDVENSIDTYSRRLNVTKQQLSLVEEESVQDLESVPSQQMPSLSPENSLDDGKKGNIVDELTGRKTYVLDHKLSESYAGPRTYTSFYDDFNPVPYSSKMSSTMIHTDSSSKDSGYPDSGEKDERPYKRDYSLPTTTLFLKKSSSHDKIEDQPKSLDSISTNSNEKGYHKTYPLDKKWSEPLNHSRLLYKDFFLKKEGHLAVPPQNTPQKTDVVIPGTSETNKSDYPSYLLNSTTKAYTSKVIEDYKKELEAINTLHELTIKDLKTDAISPTPLNIDKLFEPHSRQYLDDKHESSDGSNDNSNGDELIKTKNTHDKTADISKVSTKELIQNYLKVKQNDFSKTFSKNPKKFDRKLSDPSPQVDDAKQHWNNKNNKCYSKSAVPVNIRNQTQTPKNKFTMRTPLSARIESVQNDKDIDSWMSLAVTSPRISEMDEIITPRKEATNIDPKVDQTFDSGEKIEMATVSSPPVELPPSNPPPPQTKDLSSKSTVLDIYSMLKEIESYGDNPVTAVTSVEMPQDTTANVEERNDSPKDNFMEIFEFLEKVEQSANDALSVVTNSTPATIPKLEGLLKLPQTELAQRLVTASLQLEERSCCIALLQESLANHKEQMIQKVSNLEKQSHRNVSKVKQECEEAIKRHQNFIDQLINDKKTLNHRIEQLVDERRSLEERWKRSAQGLEERYKLELRNQHDKMAAAHQVARQRWVKQKAEKIKELTVKGLEGELREMADRQQKEVADLKMSHAEVCGRMQAKHASELQELRRALEEEKEAALLKERQMASARLEKQILELEMTYQEQRTRLVAEMRAENERVASGLSEKEKMQRAEIEKWREEQEKILDEKQMQFELEVAKQKEILEEQLSEKRLEMEKEFEQYKKDYEVEQQGVMKKKAMEISAQHKLERDREIEKAIESMEAEAQAGRKELQDALRRNKEQYETELKELAETEQATLRRYQEAQARVRHTEDKCAELEVNINQLETRNRVLTEKNILLENRVEEIRAKCEETWKAKVDELQKQMQDQKKLHEEQMHQLYAKVKVAVARKDSALQALTRDAAKHQEKITLLEQKLQQQRKDFLRHK